MSVASASEAPWTHPAVEVRKPVTATVVLVAVGPSTVNVEAGQMLHVGVRDL